VSRRKFVRTTSKDGGRQAPDLVDRNFAADRPDLLWVADLTHIPTWAGFLYLAVVLDAYSRRVWCKIAACVRAPEQSCRRDTPSFKRLRIATSCLPPGT
jgi:transposase InsO family protein